MKIFTGITFIILFWYIRLFGANIFEPYKGDIKIINNLKMYYYNGIKIYQMKYRVFNVDLAEIKNYYNSKLKLDGYNKYEEECKRVKGNIVHHLKFMNKKNEIVKLSFTYHPLNNIEIAITKINNKMLNYSKNFNFHPKKDNPGFDVKDIPRPPKSIRITSYINTDFHKWKYYNIIYKSFLSKNDLSKFYMNKMKHFKWKASYSERFFFSEGVYWMTFKKKDRNCLISIMYSDDFKSNIVSIYCGEEL